VKGHEAPVIIVGAGPGGCAAAIQCARLGVRARLLDRTGRAGGLIANAWCVENYLGLPPRSGRSFVEQISEHLARFGVEVERVEVHHVRLGARTERRREWGGVPLFAVETDDGLLWARAVIIAVGTAPVHHPVLGGEKVGGAAPVPSTACGPVPVHHGVVSLLSPDQPVPGQVVVVGGGEAALDHALALAKAGVHVTVLVRSDGLKARGRLVRLARSSSRIDIRTRTRVVGGRLVSLNPGAPHIQLDLETPDGVQPWRCDAVVVAIGRRACIRGVLSSELHAGWIPGTIRFQQPGLFVVGDARRGTLGQASMATGDGLEAAMAAVKFLCGGEIRETALHDG